MNYCGWIVCPYNSEHDKDFDFSSAYCVQDKECCELRDNPKKALKEILEKARLNTMAKWIKRKTRTMVECDACKALICWNKMNGAKFDEYWQKGNGKRLCPDCYLREVEHDA